MRIAILAPYLPNTGNTTTAERIAGHLASAGHEVFACTVNATLSIDEFLEYLSKNEIDFAIGLHGFKSGIFLKHSPIPYALIFSNTDLNVDILDPHRAEIMREAAVRARTVVTYNEEFAERIRHCWPELADVRCIHKGIHVRPDPMFSVRAMFGLSPQVSLFVLPAGLRPVKDPLYAVKAFSEWHQRVSNTALLIFGVTRHERYSQQAIEQINASPGVYYGGAIAQSQLHNAMQEAVACLNTSEHEEEPNAILESMALGTPVIARNIPGVASVILNGANGILCKSAEEIVESCELLVTDRIFRQRLSIAAQQTVEQTRTLAAEAAGYLSLLQE